LKIETDGNEEVTIVEETDGCSPSFDNSSHKLKKGINLNEIMLYDMNTSSNAIHEKLDDCNIETINTSKKVANLIKENTLANILNESGNSNNSREEKQNVKISLQDVIGNNNNSFIEERDSLIKSKISLGKINSKVSLTSLNSNI
jgi:hypothetical protein